MKSAPSAVISALANSRELAFADCFTITLADGTIARYTNAQYTVTIQVAGQLPVERSRSSWRPLGGSADPIGGLRRDADIAEKIVQR